MSSLLFQTSGQFLLLILILFGLTFITAILFIINLIRELKESSNDQLAIIALTGSLLLVLIHLIFILIQPF